MSRRVTRRSALATIAAGVAASPLTAQARGAQGNARPLDLGDPQQRLDAIVRMLGRNDGGIAVRWTDGVLSARVGAETTPLFRVLSQIFSRHRRREEGAFDAVIFEIVSFADLATGAVLAKWRNPLTDEVVDVPQTALGPTRYVIPASLEIAREIPGAPGARMQQRLVVEPPAGDDLWVTEEVRTSIPALGPGIPAFGVYEDFTLLASRTDLADRTRVHVPTVVQKANVLSYRPWMKMGERPGTTVTRGFGRIVADVAALPPHFAAVNRQYNAELLEGLADLMTFA